MSEAIGFIDMRSLTKAFAKAIMRHINHSKGLYFTEDLKRLNQMMEAEGFDVSGKLDFSYQFGANMKVAYDQMQREDRIKKSKDNEVMEQKNKEAFSKLLEGCDKKEENTVFEYKEKSEKKNEKEIALEVEDGDDEIECDFEEDDSFEYSAENLGEFMNELKS